MATKVPSQLIASGAITSDKLHTALGNTGVTANSSGLHIGQDVGTSATVQFQTITGSHAGTIAAATTGTTQANTDNSAKMATTAFVTNKIQELIGGAPSTLNDLNELAAAINDDASYNSTLTTALALKAPIASPTFTGTGRMNGDWTVGAATGEDKFIIAPQAAGSGTFLISYNDAGNAYEPLTADFETLALRTSGTPRLSIAGNGDISANGNVGIGTSSPSHKLHVKNDNDYAAKFGGTGGGDYSIEIGQGTTNSSAGFNATGSSGSMLFKISDSEKMRIKYDGNVGIGTNSPAYLLHAENSTATDPSYIATSGNGQFVMAIGSQNSPGVAQEAFVGTLSNTRFKIKVNNTVKGSWTDGGLAIGTQSSAAAPLHIQFSDNTGGVGGLLIKNTNTGTTANFASVSTQAENGTIQGTFGSSYYPTWGNRSVFAGSQTAHPFKILTGNAVRATFDTSGNVGIGTSSPTTQLHMKHASGPTLMMTRTSTNTSGEIGQIVFGNADWDSSMARIVAIQDGTNDGARLQFQTQNTAAQTEQIRMVIKKDGKVGIGTTSPGAKLEISGKDDFGASDLLRLQFDNSPADTGITLTDINSTVKSRITMDSSNTNDLRISSGTKIHLYGGTTNGTTSPHLTVSNNGNVGIATATPDYTLEVVGDSMIGDASAVTSPAFGAQQQIVKSFTYGADGAGRNGNLYLLNTNTGGDAGLLTFGGYSNHTNNLYYQTGGVGGGTEAQDGGSWGGYLSFHTVSDGSKGQASGMYEQMRITGDGHIQIKQTGSAPTNGVMMPGHIEFKGQGWDSNSGSDDMNAKIEMAATYGKVGNGATSPELVFSLQGAGGLDASSESYVEGMRLVGAGAYNNNQPRLGVGTASPSKTLDVYTSVNTGGMQITGGTGATNTSLHINNTGTNGVNWNITSTAGGHGYGDGQLQFGVAYNVPKMRITSSGNVGIGHATGSHLPRKVLEVECPSEDFVTLGARTLGTSNNWAGIHFGYKENNNDYRKSAIVFERTDRYSNNAQGKVHILNGPMSGGGSATLADAKFTINEDGNVGIGATSPERKLHIVGDTTTQGQYPLGLDAVNSDYTMEFRRNGVSEWWIAQSAGAFRIHENGVADLFRINATDGNIVLGRTRNLDTETSYTQQTFQFELDCHVNGADEAAEEKDAVFSKIWRKSAVLHPGEYQNGNYYVGIGVNSGDTVNYVVFKLNVDKATQLFASTFAANSADGTTRSNKIYYSRDDTNWTLLQSENWAAGGNTCASTLDLTTLPGFQSGFYTGTIFLKFAIEGTGSGHTNLIGWQSFLIRARGQHASLTGGGFGRSKNDLTLSGNSNTGHGYAPLLHSYGHQFSGTNQSAIVASNGGTQTFATKGFGHQEKAIFEPVTNASIGANGIQVRASGILHVTFNQDIITIGSTSYCSCTVRRYNESLSNSVTVCSTLRTNTNGHWDMINGDFICDVVAGDIITFTYAAGSISAMDGGTWSNYNFMLHPSSTTSQGNAGSSALPWLHQ